MFLTWGRVSGRSIEIAAAVGGEARVIRATWLNRPWLVPIRWAISAGVTAAVLARRRPGKLIATNPPIWLGLVCTAYVRLARVPFALDSHPGGFGAQGDRVAARLQRLHRFVAKRATVVLVTADTWVQRVESWGGRALVVHEAPSPRPPLPPRPVGDPPVVLYVGTFGGDEPVEAVVDAARMAPDLRIRMTGDTVRAPAGLVAGAPPNVDFTGYLSPEAYYDAFASADLVMVLTTEPSSVMRAACEAVWWHRPLLVTDYPNLRSVFPYALTTSNDAADLVRGMREGLMVHATLSEACPAAYDFQDQRWRAQLRALRASLETAQR
jgi:glycosyltransferase involved in cell wall biosynthesis